MKYQLEWRKGEPVICGASVDYVGGQLKVAWEEAFLSYGLIGKEWERILLVGMGASLIQILAQTSALPPQQILVLEKDPDMVRLQEAHFALPLSYRVIIGDATRTIHELNETFDGIFVDAFIEREVPESLLHKDFVQALSAIRDRRGLVLWNVLQRSQARLLEGVLQKVWPIVRMRRVGEHYFFLAGSALGDLGMPF